MGKSKNFGRKQKQKTKQPRKLATSVMLKPAQHRVSLNLLFFQLVTGDGGECVVNVERVRSEDLCPAVLFTPVPFRTIAECLVYFLWQHATLVCSSRCPVFGGQAMTRPIGEPGECWR